MNKSIKLADNAMLKHRPELFNEWDFDKNNELGLDIYKITFGSAKFAWWNCPDCGSNYDMRISWRYTEGKCPNCKKREESLATVNPELATQWHPIKNGELTPYDVHNGSSKNVWWLGECGHEWRAQVYNRKNGRGCRECSYKTNKKEVKVGINDMWTTNPELAELLLNPEDGYRYYQSSRERVDWKCKSCETEIKNKIINNVNRFGLSCPKCSDGISYGEKLMREVLLELNEEFKSEFRPIWAKDKRYDFYLEAHNMIIEVHGEQHSKGGFERVGGRNLKEEKENDRQKKNLALGNNITCYIVINALYSDFDWIKGSILNSALAEKFDIKKIDWDKVELKISSNLTEEVSSLWNKGCATGEITKELSIHADTARKYLKISSDLKLTNYSSEESLFRSRTKKVIQMTLKGEFIKEYISIGEAAEFTGANRSSISNACRGKNMTAGGFKWAYK